MRRFSVLLSATLVIAFATALIITPATVAAQASATAGQRVRVTTRTSLRAEPKTTARRLRVLAAGEEVTVRSSQRGWTRVATRNGTAGWVVSSALASRVDAAARPETAPNVAANSASPAATANATEAARTPLAANPDVRTETAERTAVPASAREPVGAYSFGAQSWIIDGGSTIGVFAGRRIGPHIAALGGAWLNVSAAAEYLTGTEAGVTVSAVLATGTVSVHLPIPGLPRLEPFAGVGVIAGRVTVNGALDGEFNFSESGNVRPTLVQQVGVRLYVAKSFALHAMTDFAGQWTKSVAVGVTWRP